MNIAFFTDNFYPQRDGVVSSAMNSATELARLGHNVLFVVPKQAKPAKLPFKQGRIKVAYVPSMPTGMHGGYRIGFTLRPGSIAKLKAFKPDIIHFHTPWGLGLSAHLAAEKFDVPLVGTNHIFITRGNSASLSVIPGYKFFNKQLTSVGIYMIKTLYDACDLRLAPSRMLIQGLKDSGYDKPFTYLPNGIHLTKIRKLSAAKKDALREVYGLKKHVVLHFGRLAKEKSIDDLLRSFARVCKAKNDVSLLIIGDGAMRKSLVALSKKLKIERSVVFAGSMSHEELVSSGIISLGDLFATASRSENQPMAVLEAMIHGLPIVGVKEAGMIDLVTTNGFLSSAKSHKQFADHMLRLLDDSALASKMSKSSASLAKKFCITKTTKKLEALYRLSIKNHAGVVA